MKSAPSSRPASPDIDDDDSSASGMIKISFRKGGDKAFYAVLKRGLKSKAWEVSRYLFKSISTDKQRVRPLELAGKQA